MWPRAVVETASFQYVYYVYFRPVDNPKGLGVSRSIMVNRIISNSCGHRADLPLQLTNGVQLTRMSIQVVVRSVTLFISSLDQFQASLNIGYIIFGKTSHNAISGKLE
jgi:hypothetical protein